MSGFNLRQAIDEYVAWDPNADSKTEMTELASKVDFDNAVADDVTHRLSSRLKFGTAGLRGPMGCGYNHMNDLVVLQTTQGLVTYIESLSQGHSKKVVIGYDHRRKGQLY